MGTVVALLFGPADGANDGVTRVAPLLFGETEAALIARLRANDEEAYARVYRVLRPRLVAIASDYVPGAVAEEIAQDVLALVWERRTGWPVERGLATHLYAAARNRARDQARHQGVVGRVYAHTGEELPGAGAPPQAPDASLERTDLGRAFVTALAQLPDGARTAFILRWVHQLGYPEVAEIMGIAEAAVRKQVSRARETLVRELRAHLE